MASDLFVILDDTSNAFEFSSSSSAVWQTTSSLSLYGGTAHTLSAGSGTGTGSVGGMDGMSRFDVTFEGKSIALYGLTPSSLSSHNISITIDNGATAPVSINAQSAAYRQWYHSPDLADGWHTITVDASQAAGVSLDFAVVAPHPATTPLKGQKLIVDDDNTAIKFLGGWRRSVKDVASGSPFRNGTHQSWNKGDSFEFEFEGSSVAVYGIFDYSNIGSVSAMFTLDGIPQRTATYSVSASTPEHLNGVGQSLNFNYFSSNASLAGGKHTLSVNITQCTNQSFILDYITYSPAFDTIAHMPGFASATSGMKTTSSATPVAPAGTDRYAGLTGTGSAANSETRKKSFSVGAAVGGCIGGLVVIVLACILIRLRRRRANMRRAASAQYDAYEDPSKPLMQNSLPRSVHFNLRPPSSSSHRSVSPYPYTSTTYAPRRPVSVEELKQLDQEQRRVSRQSQGISSRITTMAENESVGSHLPSTSTTHTIRVLAQAQAASPHPQIYGALPMNYTPDATSETTPTRRRINLDDSSSQRRVLLHTCTPAVDDSNSMRTASCSHRDQIPPAPTIAIAAPPPRLDRRTRSATDPYSYQSPLSATPLVPLRLTPIRRGFSEPQTLGSGSGGLGVYQSVSQSAALSRPVLDPLGRNSHPAEYFLNRPLRHTTAPTSSSTFTYTSAASAPQPRGGVYNAMQSQTETVFTPDSASNSAHAHAGSRAIQASTDRLTPVRRHFDDPPASAPVFTTTTTTTTRTSPIAAVFPRLSAILLRHNTRRAVVPRYVPRDIGDSDDEEENGFVPPPAYDSISPRRTRGGNSWRIGSRPLPASPAT